MPWLRSSKSVGRLSFNRKIVIQIVVSAVIPILLGCAISYLAPYYVITCTRSGAGQADCQIQQVLLGIIAIGPGSEVGNLQTIDAGPSAGSGAATHNYLRFQGDSHVEIPSNRAPRTIKQVRGFLADANDGHLQLSDGNIFFGLYLPWAISLFGLVVVVVTLSDRKEIEQRKFDRRKPIGWSAKYPGAVYFAMTAYVMACVAGLFWVYFFDIIQVQFWYGCIAILGPALVLTMFRKRRKVQRVWGKVVQLVKYEGVMSEEGMTGPSYEATIVYQVGDREYRVKDNSNPPPYGEGETVRIFYFAGHPEKGKLVGYQHHLPWLLVVVISLVIIGAVVILAPK